MHAVYSCYYLIHASLFENLSKYVLDSECSGTDTLPALCNIPRLLPLPRNDFSSGHVPLRWERAMGAWWQPWGVCHPNWSAIRVIHNDRVEPCGRRVEEMLPGTW